MGSMHLALGLAIVVASCGSPAPTPRTTATMPPVRPGVIAFEDGLPETIEPMPIAPAPMPEPPFTGVSWTAPEGTPPAMRRIAASLFERGLPDPRGCDYHAIAVHVGRDAWDGDHGIVRTRGWVLPAASNDGPRWAIAHNGMMYAVAALGAPIDLDDAARGRIASPCDVRIGDPLEQEALSAGCGFGGVDVALLVRVGRWDLAQTIVSDEALADADATTTSMLAVWSSNARVRGIGAHMRGDDVSALHALRIAARAGDAIVPSHGPRAREDIVHALLRDQERRAVTRPAPLPPLDEATIAPEHLPALIAALDHVAARQQGQPGGFAYADDPIASAILRVGPAAVAPLLDVVERDARLTRSVYAWRDFVPEREAVAVRAVAVYLVMRLLGVDHLWDETEDRPRRGDHVAIAARLRALAAAHRSAADRHLAVLFDDGATIAAWSESARGLRAPRSGRNGLSMTTPWVPGSIEWGDRVGAELRAREDEVAALLSRRLVATIAREAVEHPNSCSIASVLVAWQARREPLRALFDRCRASSSRCPCLPGLAIALRELDDPQALADYATRVRELPPRGEPLSALIEPILRYDEPSMRALAQWFVTSSPWAGHVDELLERRAPSVDRSRAP